MRMTRLKMKKAKKANRTHNDFKKLKLQSKVNGSDTKLYCKQSNFKLNLLIRCGLI